MRLRVSNPDTEVNPYKTQNVVETLIMVFYDLTIFGTNIYSVDDSLQRFPHQTENLPAFGGVNIS